MPALKPTDYYAEIVWLGRVPPEGETLPSVAVDSVDLTFAGVEGERHSGLTRPSCSRVLSQHPRGTEIANARQLAIVSREEMEATAAAMGLGALAPELVGASMVVAGLPDFTHLPPSSRLQAESGATLVVDMENRACVLPGREISQANPEQGPLYKPSAQGRRGITAWVERPGRLAVGDRLRLHIPDQRLWNHFEAVRSSG